MVEILLRDILDEIEAYRTESERGYIGNRMQCLRMEGLIRLIEEKVVDYFDDEGNEDSEMSPRGEQGESSLYYGSGIDDDFPDAFLTESADIFCVYGDNRRYKVKNAFVALCDELGANWELMANAVYEDRQIPCNRDFYENLKKRWAELKGLPYVDIVPEGIIDELRRFSPTAFNVSLVSTYERIPGLVQKRFAINDFFREFASRHNIDPVLLSHLAYCVISVSNNDDMLNNIVHSLNSVVLKSDFATFTDLVNAWESPQTTLSDSHTAQEVLRDFPGAFLVDEEAIKNAGDGLRYKVKTAFVGLCGVLRIDWRVMSGLVYAGGNYHCDGSKYQQLKERWLGLVVKDVFADTEPVAVIREWILFEDLDRDFGDAMLKSQTVHYCVGRRYKVKTMFRDICVELDVDWELLSNSLHENSEFLCNRDAYAELASRWARYKGSC